MIENYSYKPPKNKYPQYTRKDFDHLAYAQTWSKQRDYLLKNDPQRAREVLDGLVPKYNHEK